MACKRSPVRLRYSPLYLTKLSMKNILLLVVLAFVFSNCKKASNKSNESSEMVDIDGNKYPIVKIGEKTWSAQNLNVSKYRNGDIIPQVTDPDEWDALTTGAWCYYENVTDNGIVYGKLYNRYAVLDPRGLAPAGWHVATFNEWEALANTLGGTANAGDKMKNLSSNLWQSPLPTSSNSSGFSALPGGCRYEGALFLFKEERGFWWSSTDAGPDYAGPDYANINSRAIRDNDKFLFLDYIVPNVGMSVRCVKD